jgi:CheY-like chemotaxis protein
LPVIISKLLDNALKFTERGSVTVRLKQKNEGDQLFQIIEISDTGSGISAERQNCIFEPFRQGSEGFGRRYEGTGLGLTVAQRMARLLGGDISLESKVGAGSTFFLTIPAALTSLIAEGAGVHSEAEPPPIETLVEKLGHKPEALVVEDNEANAFLVMTMLQKFITVDHAFNGNEALKLAAMKNYDFILMDINLGGGIDGLETTRQVRTMPGYNGTPIAALTGYTTYEEKEKILSAGLTHYLAKPFAKDAVLKLVRKMLMLA